MTNFHNLSCLWKSKYDAIIEVAPSCIIKNWNKGAQKLFGYTKQEIIGKSVSALLSPQKKNELIKILKEIIKSKGIYNSESEYVAKKGNIITTLTTVIPVLDQSGQLSSVFILNKDFTYKSKLIEDLKAEKKRYRDIVEMAPNISGIFVDEKFIFINNAGVKALGVKNIDSLIGKPIEDLILPEDYPKFHARNLQLLNGKKTPPIELRLMRSDGSIIIVESYARYYKYLGKPAIQFVAKEITKRKKIEEDREHLLKVTKEYAAEFDAIFESIPDAIYVGNKNRIKRANRKLLDLYNVKDLAELNSIHCEINKKLNIREFDSNKLILKKDNVFDKAIKGESIIKEIIITDPKSKNQKIIRSAGAPIRANGNIIAAVVINSDITAMKKIENEISESEKRYRSLIEQAFDGIALINKHGKIIVWNSKLLELLGYTADEIINLNPKEIIPSKKILLNTKYESHKLNYELEFLRKDKSHFPAEISIRLFENGMIMYVIKDISDRKDSEELQKKLIDKLVEAQNITKNLSRQLIQAQELERRNIARELHDEIGQTLTAIKIDILNSIKFIQSLNAIEHLNDSIRMVEETLNNVREMSLKLRPSILDDLGLIPAVRWFLVRQSERSGINAKVITKPFDEKIPSEIQITCYRIIQEAVTNIIKHSKAKNMTVEINVVANELYLIISDDGIGYDVLSARKLASIGTSIGVLGMQERAEAVGGWLDIFSSNTIGTQIQAIFPLKQLE
ncbi:MAG TPA: PAS domain S-box protein [Ignavibacteriaceae bacterium]|nr:PAS domain S-box protein [Ignavibacteriaceae bacterium]